jgi:hypothetical protein
MCAGPRLVAEVMFRGGPGRVKMVAASTYRVSSGRSFRKEKFISSYGGAAHAVLLGIPGRCFKRQINFICPYSVVK